MKILNATQSCRFVGEYRDVRFSIERFDGFEHMEREFSWTHYIHLNLDKQLEDKSIADSLWLPPVYDDKRRVSYHESLHPIIEKIVFHGGCTWYSKESSEDDRFRHIKIGCDYQHSWDTGREYSLEFIKSEVQKSINSFLELCPVLKFCTGCGVYYKDVSKDGCGKCKYSKDKY